MCLEKRVRPLSPTAPCSFCDALSAVHDAVFPRFEDEFDRFADGAHGLHPDKRLGYRDGGLRIYAKCLIGEFFIFYCDKV